MSVLTYVYIYGGSNSSQAIGQRAGAVEGELKLYGIEVTTDGTGLDVVQSTPSAINGYYTLDGRKLDGVPAKKGLYIVNGRKVAIK